MTKKEEQVICNDQVPLRVADIIMEQLGGGRFIAMTGSKKFISDGNTLRMTLAKNKSEANRLFITLEGDDTYTMRFFYYFPGRMDRKTMTWSEERTKEIAEYRGVLFEELCRIFTAVTGLDARL